MPPRARRRTVRALPMTAVWLIGGPADGDVLDTSTSAGWVDVGASRYVLRQTYPLDSWQPDGWVGMFLPLYASLWAARSGPPSARS